MAIYGNPGIGCGPLRAKLNRKQRNTMSYDKNVAQQYAELGTKCRTKPKKNNSLRRILGFSLMFLFSLNFFSFFVSFIKHKRQFCFCLCFVLCSQSPMSHSHNMIPLKWSLTFYRKNNDQNSSCFCFFVIQGCIDQSKNERFSAEGHH